MKLTILIDNSLLGHRHLISCVPFYASFYFIMETCTTILTWHAMVCVAVRQIGTDSLKVVESVASH